MLALSRVAALAALVGTLIAIGGCSSSDDTLDDEVDVGEAEVNSASRPLGTFRRERAADGGGFTLIVLRSDKTFYYSQQLVTCTPGSCTDTARGTYRFSGRRDRSTGKLRTYITFYEEGTRDFLYTLQYELSGDELKYVYPGGQIEVPSQVETLERSEAEWCDAPSQCVLQGGPSCTGSFTCEEEACGCTSSSGSPAVVEVSGASGQTVSMTKGQDLLVKLSGPRLGGWHVASTTPALGRPDEGWVQGQGAIGRAGHSTFLWHTAERPAQIVGSHRVVLEIDRGHGDGVSTFEFTAKVTAN